MQIKLSASPSFTCCHTEIEAADQTQSQYTDTGPTSPSTDPKTPDPWQGRHWSTNFQVTDQYDWTREIMRGDKTGMEPRACRSGSGRLHHWATGAVPALGIVTTQGKEVRDLRNSQPTSVVSGWDWRDLRNSQPVSCRDGVGET